MIYIGIDPALSCGCAALNDDGTYIDSGVWKLQHAAGEGEGMRYVKLRRYLAELLQRAGDEEELLLAYEYVPHHNGADAARAYNRITGVILEECELRHVTYTKVTTSEVKFAATGKGKGAAAGDYVIGELEDNTLGNIADGDTRRVVITKNPLTKKA